MVLPRRIELRTSPLPRGCSTTELRQHDGSRGEVPGGAARNMPQAPWRRKQASGRSYRLYLLAYRMMSGRLR